MPDSKEKRKGFYGWLAGTVERHSLRIILVTVAVTLLLLLPLFLMKPTETASDNPTGNEVVKLNNELDERFTYETYHMLFIAEARDGDMLTQENLYELYLNEQELRASSISPFLHKRYNELAGTTVNGIYSIADAVHAVLTAGSNGAVDLSNATDLQVKQAVGYLLSNPITQDLEVQLSVKASYEEGAGGIILWKSPALQFIVESSNEKVRKEYHDIIGLQHSEEASQERFGWDIIFEHYGRDVQEILRGEQQGYRLWGVAIDVNLEIADEGRISGIMLIVAIALILILITAIFRSLLITLVSSAGLGMLIIWLKGFSNIVGLKSSIILDLIVPIAILVLGIDYAIHALFRYREEKEKGNPPQRALGNSTYSVGSALVLAMLTTVIAFGSNISSGIESVIGFAIATSIAIFASLIILGIFVPTVVMRYDSWRSRRAAVNITKTDAGFRSSRMGNIVSHVSNNWFITIPTILIITGIAAWGWLNLEAKLDPNEAFDPKSDFVTGLDKLDEHAEKKIGEPAYLYIKGDFTQSEVLDALKSTVDQLGDNEHVARRTSDGKPDAHAPIFKYLETTVQSSYTKEQIEAASGVSITDVDADLIPDTPQQLQAVFDYITDEGISRDDGSKLYTPQRIRETFYHTKAGGEDAIIMWIGIPGTREQAIAKASAAELNHDMETAMKGVPGITFYGLTGEPYVRDAQFDAITGSMNRSLLIAALACLVLLIIVFRSLRYAIATLVPVLLVACWLYGFMFAMDYHLNMMTATIAAIAIGVGIDFSIHFTERFRQELRRNPDKRTALFATARSTGMALFGTALSTALGFAVIAFAPMPMFSAFGLLTAVMIALSFIMALFALPSLLLLLAPTGTKSKPLP